MMKKPFISVIMPVYNTGQYLNQCLDSLTNQTFQDIEIICINDGSTDNSLNILKSWASKDGRIKVINFTENLKLGTARNTGIKVALGTYIGFVDSDDYVSAGFYQSLVDTLDLDVDVVTANLSVEFGKEERQIKQFDIIPDNQDAIKRDIATNGCRLWLSIFKRSFLIDNHLLFPERVVYDDNAIAICMFLLANRLIVTDNKTPVYFYRINPVSIVHGKLTEQKLLDRIATAKLSWHNMEHYNLLETYWEEYNCWFFKVFYRNTISLLIFNNFSCDTIRYIDREYKQIVGKFPHNKYMKGIRYLSMYRFIGRFPQLGYVLKIIKRIK